MRSKALAFVSAIFVAAIVTSSTAAVSGPSPTAAPAHTEVAVLPPAAPADPVTDARSGTSRSDILRESAALVLVGSMLIALAAAVRRTA